MLPLTRSRNRARFFGIPFSPSALFQGGTVAGAWYDPSDLSTMFDTSAGTTPVAMPGLGAAVPVGLMLDKSQGLVLGSELVGNTGGPFTATTGWINTSLPVQLQATPSVVNGRLRVTADVAGAVSDPRVYATITGLTVGKAYKVTYVGSSGTATSCAVAITNTAPAGGVTGGTGANVVGTDVAASFIRIAAATTEYIRVVVNGSTGTDGKYVELSSITVKELAGNHAISFNNTTARPELRARVNLLVATATLSTQSVTTQATSYTLSFAGTGSITLSGTATGSYSAGTHTITCTAGTLTLTVSGTVTTADLRPANSGALLPAYQAVVDANTYDTSGFPLYLRFDGIDDSMYTPANLNLSGTDKVSVFAGVRKNNDTSVNQLVEFSSNVTANAGAVSMPTNPTTTGQWATFLSGSTGFVNASATGTTAPITTVNTGLYDIALSADEVRLRINGTQVATSGASSAGTGNFGSYPLYIGSRANSSLWFNGHLYSLAVVGSVVSAGNIAAMESWVAGKTGIAI